MEEVGFHLGRLERTQILDRVQCMVLHAFDHPLTSAFVHTFVTDWVVLGIGIVPLAVLGDTALNPVCFCFAWTCPENNDVGKIKYHEQDPPFIQDGHVLIPLEYNEEQIRPHCW